MKKQLELGHLVLGIAVVIGGGLVTAGVTYQSFISRMDSQAEKVQQIPFLDKRLSRMERNIVRIADKVGARIEDPN